MWELSAFRTEAMSAREQTAAFSSAIEDLNKRIGAMKEVNQRLRVMLGIDTSAKPGDLVNGRGGEETPLPEGSVVPGMDHVKGSDGSLSSSGIQQGGEGSQGQTVVSAVDLAKDEKEIATLVRARLESLTKEAASQEKILSELSQVAEQRSSRWASTPSIWPVKGWVTSGFGPRISPFTEKPAWHDGLDIGAAQNAPVQAPAQGRVTSVGFDPKLGNLVRLDHGFGIETVYGHLAKSLVKEGQRVKRGDVVGLVGSSGLATGPHLHYMVKVNGQALDPNKYIFE